MLAEKLSWARFDWWLDLVWILLWIHFCSQVLSLSVLSPKLLVWVLQGLWQIPAMGTHELKCEDLGGVLSSAVGVCPWTSQSNHPLTQWAAQWRVTITGHWQSDQTQKYLLSWSTERPIKYKRFEEIPTLIWQLCSHFVMERKIKETVIAKYAPNPKINTQPA